MDLFFYGTLLDADVRRLVLGPEAARLSLEPARLRGFRRVAKRRSTAPVILRRPGASVAGMLARGLDRRQVARLDHFEGRNYRLGSCVVTLASGRRVAAMVYRGLGSIPVRRDRWRLAQWQRRHKRAFLHLMGLWMAAYREAGHLGRQRPRWIKRRAARG